MKSVFKRNNAKKVLVASLAVMMAFGALSVYAYLAEDEHQYAMSLPFYEVTSLTSVREFYEELFPSVDGNLTSIRPELDSDTLFMLTTTSWTTFGYAMNAETNILGFGRTRDFQIINDISSPDIVQVQLINLINNQNIGPVVNLFSGAGFTFAIPADAAFRVEVRRSSGASLSGFRVSSGWVN